MTCTIPRGLLVPNSNSGHRFRLQVLKLVNCNFDQFKDTQFADLGSSLRELSLSRVTFPHDDGDGGRILNSIIAGASLLQRLFLSSIVGIRRVQVGNLPSLKFLLFDQSPVEDLVITAVDSLEELFICDTPMGGDFVVSLMPNPKKLAVANGKEFILFAVKSYFLLSNHTHFKPLVSLVPIFLL
ncbi:unnamed protein product [Linum trigynum]|uniref:F-box/LRR-repeat protein 15/At3g58940/PEG3-like LRR domain-containing protein n=1 Tax=Linum trigynum TaxID=586398 RepID=A0AAV2GWC6_9ROSI